MHIDLRNVVRDFITCFSFVRLCMKYVLYIYKTFFSKNNTYFVCLNYKTCAFHIRLCLDHRLKAHAS